MEKRETSSRQTTDKREVRVGCCRLIASLLTRRATTEARTTSANMANPVRVVDRDSSKRLWEAGSGSCRGRGCEWRGGRGCTPNHPLCRVEEITYAQQVHYNSDGVLMLNHRLVKWTYNTYSSYNWT